MKNFRFIKDASSAIFDLFLPRVCIACGRELRLHEKHLCIYCRSDIPLSYNWESAHNRMADRFNELIQEGVSPPSVEPYAFAACLLRYSSSSGFSEIPRSLKYRYNLSGGRYFARMLGRYLSTAAHFSDVDLVIPVPLHFLRLWKRGYNQAEVIAREVSSALGAPLSTRLLYRRRYTRTQTKTAVSMKGSNVRGAFALRRRALLSLAARSAATESAASSLAARSAATESVASSVAAISGAAESAVRSVARSAAAESVATGFSADRSAAAESVAAESVAMRPDAPCHGPRHILLVDDVFTTGATLYACFCALRAAFPPPVRISIATLSAIER